MIENCYNDLLLKSKDIFGIDEDQVPKTLTYKVMIKIPSCWQYNSYAEGPPLWRECNSVDSCCKTEFFIRYSEAKLNVINQYQVVSHSVVNTAASSVECPYSGGAEEYCVNLCDKLPTIYDFLAKPIGFNHHIQNYNGLLSIPNPSDGNFRIQLPKNINNETKVVILSSSGDVLYAEYIDCKRDQSFIDINNKDMNTGTYFYNIFSNEQLLGTGSFTVIK